MKARPLKCKGTCKQVAAQLREVTAELAAQIVSIPPPHHCPATLPGVGPKPQ